MLEPVVDTVTLKVPAELALTPTVGISEHIAPAGAPPQVREAVPLMPCPPIESVYLAVAPGATVAELELPAAMPSPRFAVTPVPMRDTVCGLFGALSVIVIVPCCVPLAVGVKATKIWQVPNAAIEVPQKLVSEKLPLDWTCRF